MSKSPVDRGSQLDAHQSPPIWSVLLFHPLSATLLEHDVTRFLGSALEALVSHVQAFADVSGKLDLHATVKDEQLAQLVVRSNGLELASIQGYWLEHDEDTSGIDLQNVQHMEVHQLLGHVQALLEG